jgi:hypothetical protein
MVAFVILRGDNPDETGDLGAELRSTWRRCSARSRAAARSCRARRNRR